MKSDEKPRGEGWSSSQLIGKLLLFFLLIFGAAILQTSLFGATRFFRASPDLLLAAVVGIAIYDGEKSAAAAGIAAGWLCEALGGAGSALMPVFYMLAGYIVGYLSRVSLRKNALSWLVVMVSCAGAKAVMSLVYLGITEKHFNFIIALVNQLAPEFFMTLLFSVPILFLSRACARPFHKQIDLD